MGKEEMEAFPEDILQRLRAARIAAGFTVEKAEHAVPLTQALLAGGVSAIELTLRTPAALEGLQAICQEVSEMLIGVGTILTTDMVKQVKDAGADFGVAPGLNPRVVKAAQEAALPFAPGVATPSDIEKAVELNCRVMKFFPAQASGGVKYLRSMSAPYKHLGIEYFPLGGINSDNMMEYLSEPNVVALGGTWVVKKEMVAAEDWSGITRQAKEIICAMRDAGVVGSA